MAEGLVNYTRLDDPEEIIVNTQGRPMSPFDEVRVLDDDGRDVAPGEAGHLFTRGLTRFADIIKRLNIMKDHSQPTDFIRPAISSN